MAIKLPTSESPFREGPPKLMSPGQITYLDDDTKCLHNSSSFLFIDFYNIRGLRPSFHFVETCVSNRNTRFRGYF